MDFVRTLLLLAGLLTPSASAEIFTDRAAAVGIDFVHFNGMSGELYFAEMMGGGAALFDYDNDGDLDVFLVQGHMLGPDKTVADALVPPRHPSPFIDRLYRNDLANQADGSAVLRFTDVTAQSELRAGGYGMGVAAADYDNDGDVDLYITNLGGNQLWRNDGDGTFSDATTHSGTGDRGWGVAATFFDYDRDGWLDLFVGNYVDYRIATHRPCASKAGAFDYCSPLSYQPSPNVLYRNRGDGTFEDASKLLSGKPGNTLGAVATDIDRDGWLDLYVTNDLVPNQLWRNGKGEGFVDEAMLGGCAVNEDGQPEAGMGVIAADLAGAGSDDLFMTHLTGETNTYYRNDGQGLFEDLTRKSGLAKPSWPLTGFGIGLLDYDNDGWLDLYVANGAVLRIEELARQGAVYPLGQRNQLFHNLGRGRFEELGDEAGASLAQREVSRGVAAGDVDNDGDTDLLVVNNAGPARLLINNVGQDQPWLGLRLLSGASRDAFGARVTIRRADGLTLTRRVASDGSYAAAGDSRVLVGLGAGGGGEIKVQWPGGGIEVWKDLPRGTYTTLREGTGTVPPETPPPGATPPGATPPGIPSP